MTLSKSSLLNMKMKILDNRLKTNLKTTKTNLMKMQTVDKINK